MEEKLKQAQQILHKNLGSDWNDLYQTLYESRVLVSMVEFSNQVQAGVMPNEVLAGEVLKLTFGEDEAKLNLWSEIVNDVYMEYDSTSEGEKAEILMGKIEKLLVLVSQREA